MNVNDHGDKVWQTGASLVTEVYGRLYYLLTTDSRFYTLLRKFYKNVAQRRGMLVRGILGDRRKETRTYSAC